PGAGHGAGGRHPALLRRHPRGPPRAGLRAVGVVRDGARRARTVARGPGGGRPRGAGRARARGARPDAGGKRMTSIGGIEGLEGLTGVERAERRLEDEGLSHVRLWIDGWVWERDGGAIVSAVARLA